MGAKYVPFAYLLPALSLSLFFVSLLNLFVSYFLALRSRILFKISMLGFAATVLFVVASHATAEAIVADFVFGGAFTLVLLAFFVFLSKKIS
jgi:hypothetical protein